MFEGRCPLVKSAVKLLENYGRAMGGGNSSQYVVRGLKSGGMTEGLMRFAEICDSSGAKAAERMGLGDNINSRDFLSFLHMAAAGPLLGLSILGENGKKLATAISKIKIKLPNASSTAQAVDWVWEGIPDG